ncbi:MAG: tRNA preQ1(34) S-adenosylmethionine ribosyltransferase-isomerase QueA [Planctomycetota bacterium]
MSERAADYDYEVPLQAIAQVPAARRDEARLLLVARAAAAPEPLADSFMAQLPALLRPGDLLVVNEARVMPARLTARREGTGGRVSVLVLQVHGDGRRASVLLGTRGTPLPGESLRVGEDRWRIESAAGEGRFEIVVEQGREIGALMAEAGRMPLPPYIERAAEQDARDALDRERYQTVFSEGCASSASVSGSRPQPTAAAAPTAGLHFTAELLAALQRRGVLLGRLRLDVGEGTFRPLRGETLAEHLMHTERYEIPVLLAEQYARLRREQTGAAGGPRLVAVGTTVVRALESAVSADGRELRAGPAETSLFLKPGAPFRAVEALLTNFHQPRSTLLVLVSAFAGLKRIRAAYRHALDSGYRVFSYGDAMLIA